MRCRYHALLQLLAFGAVVAFHSELPGFTAGWFAVELFFALAGYNMAHTLQRETPLKDYLLGRYRRLAAPLVLLLPAVLLLAVLGSKSALVYVVSAPFQVHNLMRFAMVDWKTTDMVWIPTWFIGALFQLQIFALLLKRVLLGAHVSLVLIGATGLGMGFRALGGELLDGEGALSFSAADTLYWAPITHVEALIGGVQLGLGRMNGLKRSVPWLGALVVVAILGLALSSASFPTIAFPLGSGAGHEHVWGYGALAAGAVLLVDKRQAIARFVLDLQLSPRLDRGIELLSRLTFVGYLLHGAILTLLTRLLARTPDGLAFSASPLGTSVVTLGVVALALAGAALVHQLLDFVAQRFALLRGPNSAA